MKSTAAQQAMIHQRLQALARTVRSQSATGASSSQAGHADVRADGPLHGLQPREFHALMQHIQGEAAAQIASMDLDALQALSDRANRHAARYVATWLGSSGAELGIWWTADEAARRLGISPLYARAWRRLLKVSALYGHIQEEGGRFHFDGNTRIEPPAPLGDAPVERFLRRSGEHLGAILKGQMHAAEALFEGGRADLAIALYTETAPFRYCNEVTRLALQWMAEQRPRGTMLRALEIGAGTGGTTRSLMGLAQAQFESYWFTDVSGFFFDSFRESAEPPPVFRYAELDIEDPTTFESANIGRFNVVVCAHVLHATRDIAETLAHTRQLMAPGGLLCLLEETSFHPFFSMTMGLQTGFDRYEDEPLRTEHPLLSAEQWASCLTAAGFRHVETLPEVGGISPLFALG